MAEFNDFIEAVNMAIDALEKMREDEHDADGSLLLQMPFAEAECTCCEYRVGDLCCYSDVKTDMEAMGEGEQE